MLNLRPQAFAAPAAVTLTLIVAGCGSSKDRETSHASATSGTSAVPSATTTGEAAAPIKGPNVSCTATMQRLRQMTAPKGRGNQSDCSLNGKVVSIQVVYHGENLRQFLTPAITKIMWVVIGDDWYAYGPVTSGGQAQAEAVAKELGGTVYNP